MDSFIKTTTRKHGIQFYNYNEFINVEKMDDDGYGTTQKANCGLKVALKSLNVGHEEPLSGIYKR
ncbi:hypothetical protein F8M41_006915, partial [Gigaspora margarita]